jgi:hypothetical protein
MARPEATPWESPGSRGPSRARTAVLALVLLVSAALAAGRLAGGADSELAVTGDARTPDPAPMAPPAPAGVWLTRPAAPLPVPAAHRAAWAGDALVAWGNEGQVAAYSPSERRWNPLGRAPVGAVLDPSLEWTGSETLVWGGQRADGSWSAEGAAVDHRTAAWRTLPAAPATLRRPVTAWTGEELLVWGMPVDPAGQSGGGQRAVGLALDPARGRWRELEPAPVEGIDSVAGAWTGGEWLLWGRDAGRVPFAVAYDPGAGGGWRVHTSPPLSDPARAAAAWAGEDGAGELVLWGRPLAGQRPTAPPAGAALDASSGRWRLLPPAPGYDWTGSRWGVQGLQATWTGERVVFVGGYPSSVTLSYDPERDSWSTLAELAGVIDPVVRWTGEFVSGTGVRRRGELLLWGGYGPYGPTVDLRSWRTVGLGPAPVQASGHTPPGVDRQRRTCSATWGARTRSASGTGTQATWSISWACTGEGSPGSASPANTNTSRSGHVAENTPSKSPTVTRRPASS